MSYRQLIRTWKAVAWKGDFELRVFDIDRTDDDGKWTLAYEFYHNEELIFSGDDYHVSPLHAVDSNASIAGLLGFLSLRPGDTDSEYFEDYTPRQLEWCKEYGEILSIYAEDLWKDA